MSYNDVVWLPNALVLTAVLGLIAYWRWRRKGAVAGLRWTGIAMLPLAIYAIGAFRLFWNVSLAVSHFVSGFVFRPSVWLGIVLAIVAVMLIVVPSRVAGRLDVDEPRSTAPPKRRQQVSDGDDDMTEIEDILKKHGIG